MATINQSNQLTIACLNFKQQMRIPNVRRIVPAKLTEAEAQYSNNKTRGEVQREREAFYCGR